MRELPLILAIMILFASACGYLFASPAAAQIVVDDCEKFTEDECSWLHSQFLKACESAGSCPNDPKAIDFSMSTIRGMYSLETCMTARAYDEVYQACHKVCSNKKRMPYREFRKKYCVPPLSP